MKLPEIQKVRTSIDSRKIGSLRKVYNDVDKLRDSILKHKKWYGEELFSADELNSLLKSINNELDKISQSNQNLINGGLCVI